MVKDENTDWSSSQDGGAGKHGFCHPAYHTKITITLQSKHYSEVPEIELNGSPTTTELKKKPQ